MREETNTNVVGRINDSKISQTYIPKELAIGSQQKQFRIVKKMRKFKEWKPFI
jgi:hypothetical protein